MNILHLTHTDLTDDSRILKEVSALSSKAEYNLRCIYCRSDKHDVNKLTENFEAESISLVSNRRKWSPRPLRHALTLIELTIRLFFLAISKRIDVVHAHDTMVLPVASMLKLITRCKLIYDAHELESNKNGQSIALSKFTFLIERMCWRQVVLLISVSDSIIQWYNENFEPRDSCLILNSPVLDLETEYDANYIRNKYDIPKDERVCIYIGYLSKGRGIELILDVFQNYLSNYHLVFLGTGDLRQKIESSSSLNANIHYHEPVSHEQVINISRGADIGLCLIEPVSLSDYYCLPNKFFEYAYANLTIVGSQLPEIKKYIENYKLGISVNSNSKDLTDALRSLTLSEYFELPEELSWEFQAKKLQHLYATLFE